MKTDRQKNHIDIIHRQIAKELDTTPEVVTYVRSLDAQYGRHNLIAYIRHSVNKRKGALKMNQNWKPKKIGDEAIIEQWFADTRRNLEHRKACLDLVLSLDEARSNILFQYIELGRSIPTET